MPNKIKGVMFPDSNNTNMRTGQDDNKYLNKDSQRTINENDENK